MGINVDDPLWKSIENEYLTLHPTMRELSKKYHVPPATISDHSRRGHWQEKWEQIQMKGSTKLIDRINEDSTQPEEKAQLILDGILTKIAVTVDLLKPGDTRAFKELTSTMKELKELGVYKGEEVNNSITVTFVNEEEARYGD